MIELYINIFKGPKFGRDNYSANRVRFNWSVSSIGPLWLFQILHGSPRGGSAQESPVPEQQRMPSLAELPPAQINPVWKRKTIQHLLGDFLQRLLKGQEHEGSFVSSGISAFWAFSLHFIGWADISGILTFLQVSAWPFVGSGPGCSAIKGWCPVI